MASQERKPTIATNQNTLAKEINRGKSHCNICKSMFGFFNREHICKRCYRNIDSNCFNPKDTNAYPNEYRTRVIPGYNISGRHKICIVCQRDSREIEILVNAKNKSGETMLFGRNHPTYATTWFKIIDPPKSYEEIKAMFLDLQKEDPECRNSVAYKNWQVQVSQMLKVNKLDEMFPYNYSFRECIFLLQNKHAAMGQKDQLAYGPIQHPGTVTHMIQSVMHAFLRQHYADIGYHKEIFDMTVFLLCFLEPCRAWYMLCYIFEQIVPQWAHPIHHQTSGFKFNENANKQFCQLMRDQFNVETSSLSKISEFLDVEGTNLMSSACIGKVSFAVSFYIFENLLNAPKPVPITVKGKDGKEIQIPQTPMDRDQALIRAVLIITRLNLENILVLGAKNPSLPRIMLEDTRFSDYQTYIKQKNISFPRVDVNLSIEDPTQGITLIQLRNENAAQSQIIQTQQHTINQLESRNIDLSRQIDAMRSQLTAMNQSQILDVASKTQLDQVLRERNALDAKVRQQMAEYERLQQEYYSIQQRYNVVTVETSSNSVSMNEYMNLKNSLQQLENQYAQIEEKYVKTALKLVIISAECKRLQNQGNEFEQFRKYTKEPRKNTMQWEQEIGLLMVQLNTKEEELNRTKKSLQTIENDYQQKFDSLRYEYDSIAAKELENIKNSFELEKKYFNETISERENKINELSSMLGGKVPEQTSTINYQQQALTVQIKELEAEKGRLRQDLDHNLFRLQHMERSRNSSLLRLALMTAECERLRGKVQ